MKAFRRLSSISFLFLFLSALTAAWPWPDSAQNGDALILRRQGNEDSTSTSQETSSSTKTSTAKQASKTSAQKTTDGDGNSKSAAATSGESAAASGSSESAAATSGATQSGNSTSGNSTQTTHHVTKTTAIDPRLPPGGVEMVTPAVTDGNQYYKIGDYVTFGWNYTSLSVTPTAIDILASCSINNQIYTIALNQSVDPTGAVTWDTGEYQATATIPLLTETYTLIIHDADKEISAFPSAGYLDTFDLWTFGMYQPQSYTPLNEFRCATCNAALSVHERQAFGLLLLTSVITVASFTWFANGFGIFL